MSNTGIISAYSPTGSAPVFRMLRDSIIQWDMTTNGSTFTLNNGVSERITVTAAGDLTIANVGSGLLIKEGSNAKMGAATLVGGTVTVNTTAVTANSRIYLTSQVDGGTPGYLRVSGRVAATSFTITSGSGTDTSTVAWMIVEPAP